MCVEKTDVSKWTTYSCLRYSNIIEITLYIHCNLTAHWPNIENKLMNGELSVLFYVKYDHDDHRNGQYHITLPGPQGYSACLNHILHVRANILFFNEYMSTLYLSILKLRNLVLLKALLFNYPEIS